MSQMQTVLLNLYSSNASDAICNSRFQTTYYPILWQISKNLVCLNNAFYQIGPFISHTPHRNRLLLEGEAAGMVYPSCIFLAADRLRAKFRGNTIYGRKISETEEINNSMRMERINKPWNEFLNANCCQRQSQSFTPLLRPQAMAWKGQLFKTFYYGLSIFVNQGLMTNSYPQW